MAIPKEAIQAAAVILSGSKFYATAEEIAEAALTAALPHLQRWQPISTAPIGPEGKSQSFLAYAPADEDSDWGAHHSERYAVCYYSCSDTLCELVTGFMFDESAEGEQEEFKPTYWMPLPPPPGGAL